MVLVKIAAFVVPLGIDTLAVAVLLGLRGVGPLRPALVFAFFEAVMPLIGIVAGRFVGARFETPAVITGGVVLIGVAAYMLKEKLEDSEEADNLSFDSWRVAMLAGFGVCMDELAIGFPMGTSGLPIPQTLGAIAVQTFIVTFAGCLAGRRVGESLGRRTARVAGFVAAGAFALLGGYLIVQRLVPGLPEV
ncbi:MAG: manganese efflux pump MntP family protein [Vulcanimicrobiaceae bacterium]